MPFQRLVVVGLSIRWCLEEECLFKGWLCWSVSLSLFGIGMPFQRLVPFVCLSVCTWKRNVLSKVVFVCLSVLARKRNALSKVGSRMALML